MLFYWNLNSGSKLLIASTLLPLPLYRDIERMEDNKYPFLSSTYKGKALFFRVLASPVEAMEVKNRTNVEYARA